MNKDVEQVIVNSEASNENPSDSDLSLIKWGLFGLGAYLLISSVLKLFSLVYVYNVDSANNLSLRAAIENNYAAFAMPLDIATYLIVCAAAIVSFFRHRSAVVLFLVALVMKVAANLYNIGMGPGFDSLTADSVFKAMIAWGIILGAYLLARSAKKHKILF